MFKRIVITIIILGVLGGGGYFGYKYYQSRTAVDPLANLTTTTVIKGTISTSVLATGSVSPNQTANLSWQTTGVVQKVNVKLGDVVTPTEILAALSPASPPTSVINAQVDLANAQKALDDLLNSQVPVVKAKQAIETAQKALDDLVNSQVPVVQAKQVVENAQKAVIDYTVNFPVTQATAQQALVDAQKNFDTMTNRRNALNYSRASEAQISAANANYIIAKANVDKAQKGFDSVANLGDSDPRKAQAYTQLSDAQKKRDQALASVNWYMGQPTDADIAAADSNLAQAKAALAQAQFNWERIKDGPNATDVEMLKAQLADAQRAYDSVKDGPNATDVEMLKAQLADAQRAYDAIKDGPNPADVEAAKARIAVAQATADQMYLRAPITGTVTQILVQPGDQASSGKVVVRIDNLNKLLVDVNVSEIDIANVKVDQATTMTFDAIPGKVYNGKVTEVSMIGTSTQGVVSFVITMQFSDADVNVKPGLTANVDIITQRKPNVMLLPNRAIHTQGTQRYVVVLSGGVQTNVPVTVGLTNETNSEVTSDSLHEGDEVVTSAISAATTTNRPGGAFFGGGAFGR